MHPTRALTIPAALLLTAFLAAGCGSSSKSTSTSSSPPAKSAPAAPATAGTKVTIAGFKYKPASLSVKVGQKVTFTNTDSANHTATASDGSFDTGNLAKGATKTITFGKPGTYSYKCDFHPFMKGTVTVR